MNNFFLVFFLVLFNLLNLRIGICQNTIFAKVINKDNQEPLIGVIITDDQSKGQTITNENGEFILNVNSFPASIKVRILGFQSQQFLVESSKFQTISLSEAILVLPELKVYANKGLEILQNAVNKAVSDTSSMTYLKAYYQKTSSQNGKYTWLNEMYLNMESGQYGVSRWQPTNARYAHAIDEFASSNFIFLCLSSTRTLTHNYNTAFPLNNRNISGRYSYKLLNYVNQGSDEEIAIIECKPKPENNEFFFTGRILVNTKSSNILKINGKFSDIKSNRKVEIDLNFKESERGFSVFHNLYIVVKAKIDRKNNIEKAWLIAIQDLPNLNKNDKTYPLFGIKDLEIFENTSYNEKEWERGLPIKYTAEAEKVIKYFGKKKSIIGNIK